MTWPIEKRVVCDMCFKPEPDLRPRQFASGAAVVCAMCALEHGGEPMGPERPARKCACGSIRTRYVLSASGKSREARCHECGVLQ